MKLLSQFFLEYESITEEIDKYTKNKIKIGATATGIGAAVGAGYHAKKVLDKNERDVKRIKKFSDNIIKKHGDVKGPDNTFRPNPSVKIDPEKLRKRNRDAVRLNKIINNFHI